MDIMGSAKKREDGERREKSRFPIGRELRFKLLEDTRVLESGTGETLNMGSGGVLFSAKKDLQPGLFVELSISWPVLLAGCFGPRAGLRPARSTSTNSERRPGRRSRRSP
jgi:hypothetical protein